MGFTQPQRSYKLHHDRLRSFQAPRSLRAFQAGKQPTALSFPSSPQSMSLPDPSRESCTYRRDANAQLHLERRIGSSRFRIGQASDPPSTNGWQLPVAHQADEWLPGRRHGTIAPCTRKETAAAGWQTGVESKNPAFRTAHSISSFPGPRCLSCWNLMART